MRRSARFAYSVMLLAVTATALVIALRTSRADASQVPAATATRQERLKERDKFEKQAKDLRAKGKRAEAIQAALAVLAIEREVLGETSDDAISTINWIADLHQEASEWADALKALSEVEAILSRKLGKDHWRAIDAHWAIDKVSTVARLDDRGRRKLAEADRLYTQGGRLMSQGRSADALKALRQGMAIRKELQGEGHPDYAMCLNNLAYVLQALDQEDEALANFKLALEKRKALYPRSHPDLATTLTDLGTWYTRHGDYVQAIRYFEQALATNESLYPREKFPQGHFRVAQSLTNLAYALRRQGPTEEVRRYLERATAMNEALYPEARFPKGHPDLATSLNDLGNLLGDQGDFVGARPYLERSLAMRRVQYPRETFPQGHPELATALANLGTLLGEAGKHTESRTYLEQSLAMRQALYPKMRYPFGHPDLATSLANLGSLLGQAGRYAEARRYHERALEMRQALYPKATYPSGHRELSSSLIDLGTLLGRQGNYAEARPYMERSLAMLRALYPKATFPQGHPELATGLSNLGTLLGHEGKYTESRTYLEQSLAMRRALYPEARYPSGHPEVAASLDNLGSLLAVQSRYAEARPYLEQSLAVRQALYPKEKYPSGHRELAASLNNLGFVLAEQGEYDLARASYRRSSEMCQLWYPKEAYPQGHYALAMSLANLGSLLERKAEYVEAWRYLDRASTMFGDLAEIFMTGSSEAEALDFLARIPSISGSVITCSSHLPEGGDAAYAHVWRGKAAVARTLLRRQASLSRRAGTDPATRQLVSSWNDRRQELARLMMAPFDGHNGLDRLRRLEKLTLEKEQLERQLAVEVPDFARDQRLGRSSHGELLKVLPERTVVVDLVQYARHEQDPRKKGNAGLRIAPSYVGFVLARDRPVRRVDFGAATTIDDAVRQWRSEIVAKQPGPSAEILRRRIWEPLSREFPPGTTTVLLAPDGLLTAIPWSALPGERPGTVLLDQYALATVPHAPIVLDLITAPPLEVEGPGIFLGVGGLGENATAGVKELEIVSRLAGPRRVVRLEGATASTTAVIRELPRASWAHFATHGFFADPSVRSVLSPDANPFNQLRREGAATISRNPLVLSGLVLAGTGRPSADVGEGSPGDHGILTAEAIAGLPLQDLDLAVLAACETGLGTVAGGEGVFGLQRAFHLAGTRAVVASLWSVEDRATHALMVEFYKNLWEKKLPRLEALRLAQLTLMRQYGWQTREGLIRLDEKPARPSPGGQDDRLPPFYWAAFVLSGDWR
ncbi:MAG: CHAT domain-containing tetratricopeptide repeat protein [Isosphaeraceae bacterium]